MSIEKIEKQSISEDELDSVSGGMRNATEARCIEKVAMKLSQFPNSPDYLLRKSFDRKANCEVPGGNNLGMLGANIGGIPKPGAPAKGHGILDNTEEIM